MLVPSYQRLRFLLLLALVVTGAPSLAQARHLRHYGDDATWRTNDAQDHAHGQPTVFTTSMDRMIRACSEQATVLRKLLLDLTIQSMQLSDDQRDALERVRTSVHGAAQTLDADCPKSIPPELGAKLDMLDHALTLIVDSLIGLRPAVLTFYVSLHDEQKGKLVVMGLSGPAPRSGRARTRKDVASGNGADPDVRSICAQWAANLRTWPVRQIDAGMQLSDPKRAALYELTAAIYRSAADLVEACPVENATTPLSRLDARQNELQALREDINAIRPSAAAFESDLTEVQRKRLADAMESEAR